MGPTLIKDEKRKHAFFDIGDNSGESIDLFMRGKSSNNSLDGYGSRGNYAWIIYAIEANSIFSSRLEALTRGHLFHLYKETVAWNMDGYEKFNTILSRNNENVYLNSHSLGKYLNKGVQIKTKKSIDIAKLVRAYKQLNSLINV